MYYFLNLFSSALDEVFLTVSGIEYVKDGTNCGKSPYNRQTGFKRKMFKYINIELYKYKQKYIML